MSRLGPPSVYDYWLSGYSLIISQKSITTSERMPEKINDLAAAETRNEVGSSRDATRRHCSILLRQSQSMTKKKLECYALPLAISIALYYISLLIGFGKYSIDPLYASVD